MYTPFLSLFRPKWDKFELRRPQSDPSVIKDRALHNTPYPLTLRAYWSVEAACKLLIENTTRISQIQAERGVTEEYAFALALRIEQLGLDPYYVMECSKAAWHRWV